MNLNSHLIMHRSKKGENIRMTTIVGTHFQPMIRLDME